MADFRSERWPRKSGQGVKLVPWLRRTGLMGKVTRKRYAAEFKAEVASIVLDTSSVYT